MLGELAGSLEWQKSRVKDLVEAGKVGFPEVQKVIEGLTNKGGKFGALMEEQSKDDHGSDFQHRGRLLDDVQRAWTAE